jgi:hypothetical protein
MLIISCGKKDGKMPIVSVDAQAIPIVHTDGVSELISDSGVTRYRLNAEIKDVYSNNNEEPYWHFPEKFYMEKFDSLFNIEANIKADTAYFYEKRELWHLIGNVIIMNLEGIIFETSELFWNMKTPADAPDAIYTDKPVKIILLSGDTQYHRNGFKSDQYLRYPMFFSTSEDITVRERTDSLDQEEVQPDII